MIRLKAYILWCRCHSATLRGHLAAHVQLLELFHSRFTALLVLHTTTNTHTRALHLHSRHSSPSYMHTCRVWFVGRNSVIENSNADVKEGSLVTYEC